MPMSTTWTFLGLLSGREIGICLTDFTWERFATSLKMMMVELFYLFIGLGISVTCKWLS